MITTITRACALLLALSSPLTTADGQPQPGTDPVANPAAASQLVAIPAADLSGLDTNTARAIQQAREQLGGLLDAKPASSNLAPNPAPLAAAYARLAALYQHAAIDGAAATAWRNAATLQPDDYRWRYYQGWQALNNGQIPLALEAFEQARERKPDYAPLQLRLGQAWLADNQSDRAEAALQQAAEQPGLRAAALYYLAQGALLRRDYALALQQLEEARQLAPDAAGLHYPLAQALRGLGQREQARRHLALVPPGKPAAPPADDPLVAELAQVVESAQPDFNNAMQAVRKRDYPTALEHFAAGLEIAPDNHHARNSYARALWLAGERQPAQQQLRQVLEQQPRDALATFMLALMTQQDGNEDDAMRLYARSIELDPGHQGAHYYLANLLYGRGEYQQAASHYRAAQQGDSELPTTRLLAVLASHHADLGNTAKLADELRALVEKYPRQPELRYAQILLYALSTDPDIHDDVAAVTIANQLLQDQPGPAPLHALALAVAANGQFEVAADIQQHTIERLQWNLGSAEMQNLQEILSAYQAGTLPTLEIWPLDDAMLEPPPFDALPPIREYLAPTPY